MLLRILGIVFMCIAMMGATCQNRPDPVLPPTIPKPTINYQLLEACDTVIPAVRMDADPIDYLANHQLAIRKLDACACRQITLRNLACTWSTNNCKPFPECEVPKNAE